MNREENRQILFSALIVVAVIWIGMNRTLESVLSVIVMGILYYGVYYSTSGRKSKRNETPDYAKTYQVTEEHNDFSKVGSGYPINFKPIDQSGNAIKNGQDTLNEDLNNLSKDKES